MLGIFASNAGRLFPLCVILPIWAVATSSAQSVDALYEKAKLERTVSLYGAGPSDPFKRWIEDFQKKYPGVAVQFTGGLSNFLDKKIDQQLADKAMEADVGIFQTIQDFVRWKKVGALMLFKPEGFETIDPAFKDEDGAFTTVSVNMVTYAYNTQAVATADVPKSALGFLKPMFREKLITTDPSDDDAGLMAFHSIIEKYGWSYMDKYMTQKPRFTRDGHATVSNAVAAGEMLATFDSTSTTPRLIREGKPIQLVLSQVRRHCSWCLALFSRMRHIRMPQSSSLTGILLPSSKAATAPSRRVPMWHRQRAGSRSQPTISTAAFGCYTRTRPNSPS